MERVRPTYKYSLLFKLEPKLRNVVQFETTYIKDRCNKCRDSSVWTVESFTEFGNAAPPEVWSLAAGDLICCSHG
jgi:hypothetical protein